MELNEKMDKLMSEQLYVVDVFPKLVPKKENNRYFQVEEYLREHGEEIDHRFTDLLLKLYCYFDFTVLKDEETLENPTVEQLKDAIEHCFEGLWQERSHIGIYLPECDSAIVVDGGDLYLHIYHPSKELQELLAALARSEEMFFYPVK